MITRKRGPTHGSRILGKILTWHCIGAGWQVDHGGSGAPGSQRILTLRLYLGRITVSVCLPWTRMPNAAPAVGGRAAA